MFTQFIHKGFNSVWLPLTLSSIIMLVPGGITLVLIGKRVVNTKSFQRHRSRLASMGLIMALFMTSAGCSNIDSQPAVAANISEKEIENSVPVEIQPLQSQDFTRHLSVTGSFTATDEITISSQVEGIIQNVVFEEGAAMKKGQLLLKIDDAEARLKVQQVEVALALAQENLKKIENLTRPEERDSAKATLDGAKARLKNARTQMKRTWKLFEQGMVSKEKLDRDQMTLDTAFAEMTSAQKALELAETGARAEDIDICRQQAKQAQINLSLAQITLQRHTIYSPLTGEIVHRHVDHGEMIRRGDRIATLINIDPIKVKIQISEQDIARFQTGDSVQVSCGAYAQRTFEGKIKRISSKADPSSRSFPVEIELANPDKKLKPGMVARVKLVLDNYSNVFRIPWESIILEDELTSVFLVSDNKAVSRKVHVISRHDEWALVDQGLKENDKLVITGQERLKDGILTQTISPSTTY